MKTMGLLLFSFHLLSAHAAVDSPQKSRLTSDQTEANADHRQLVIYPGEEKIVDIKLNIDDPKLIKVGNPKILGVDLVIAGDKRQIVFKPTDKGECRVVVRDEQKNTQIIFDIRIVDTDLNRMISDLKELLKDVEGINISIKLGKIVIDGEVVVPADYGRISAVTADPTVKGRVINMVTMSPLALQFLAKRIQENINKDFGPAVTTRVVNGQIWLEGTVRNDEDAQRAYKVATLYLPEAKIPMSLIGRDASVAKVDPKEHPLIRSFLTKFDPDAAAAAAAMPPPPPPPPPMVKVTAHFVELSKDFLKDFGFKWKPAFSAPSQITIGQVPGTADVSGSGSSFSATISSLIPRLWSSQNAGFAKVLKTATVITKNGVEGRAVNSIQIPVPGPSGIPTNAGVNFSMTVTPTVVDDVITMNTALEMGSIIGMNASGAMTSSNTITTSIDVKSGDSAAIGGIENLSLQSSFNRDGGGSNGQFVSSGGQIAGGDVQALFDLERSKNTSKQRTQFVVFLTPEIIEDAGAATNEMKKNFRIKVK